MPSGLKLAAAALLLAAVLPGAAANRALAQESPDQLLPVLASVGQALDAAPVALPILDESSGPPGPVQRNAAPPSDRADLPPALARAEAAFAAGQPRQALDALDAGLLPGELGD